jgi:hypothetical protein
MSVAASYFEFKVIIIIIKKRRYYPIVQGCRSYMVYPVLFYEKKKSNLVLL